MLVKLIHGWHLNKRSEIQEVTYKSKHFKLNNLHYSYFCRSEEIEDAWMALFGHIARVMAHGHTFYFQRESIEKNES
jgi:hypothetical protein